MNNFFIQARRTKFITTAGKSIKIINSKAKKSGREMLFNYENITVQSLQILNFFFITLGQNDHFSIFTSFLKLL